MAADDPSAMTFTVPPFTASEAARRFLTSSAPAPCLVRLRPVADSVLEIVRVADGAMTLKVVASLRVTGAEMVCAPLATLTTALPLATFSVSVFAPPSV